jgi:hypothetical protein
VASEDAPKKRVALKLNLAKTDGKWTILVDDALRAGIFVQEPMTGDEFTYEAYEFKVVDTKTSSVTYTGEIIEGVCAFMEGELEMYAECDPVQVESLESTKGQAIEITFDVLSDIADAGEGNETEYYSLTAIN